MKWRPGRGSGAASVSSAPGQGASGPFPDVQGYQILREIGRGGFSVVYEAIQLSVGRRVAVKVIDFRADKRTIERFKNEVHLQGSLRHPNIVTIYDGDRTVAEQPWLSMELYDGSLAHRLSESTLDVEDVLQVGLQIGAALAFAHGKEVIHRDVKPENILYVPDKVVLADFGIAAFFHDARASRTHTPAHAAPEVLRTEAATALSDIYSLGSTLYQLLAREPPKREPDGTLVQVMRTDVADHPIMAVIDRCLEPEPRDRYQSADELVAAIGALAPRTAAGAPVAPPLRQRVAGTPAVDHSPTIGSGPAASAVRDATTMDPAPLVSPPPADHDFALTETSSSQPPPPLKPPQPVSGAGGKLRWPWYAGGSVLLVGLLTVAVIVLMVRAGRQPQSHSPETTADRTPPPSTTVSASTPAPSVAEAVRATGLKARRVSATSVTLTWTNGTGAFELLFVEPIKGGRNGVPQASIPVPGSRSTSYTVPVAPDTPYCFIVRSFLGVGVAPVDSAPACIP